MEQLISTAARVLGGLPRDPPSAGGLRRLALIIGTLIAAMRISPVRSLRGLRRVLDRDRPEHAAHPRLLLHRVRAARCSASVCRTCCSAFIALTYYTSPFVAEALRSGINGVPLGQAEAARSIGLGFGQTVSLVVLPQAFRMTCRP